MNLKFVTNIKMSGEFFATSGSTLKCPWDYKYLNREFNALYCVITFALICISVVKETLLQCMYFGNTLQYTSCISKNQ